MKSVNSAQNQDFTSTGKYFHTMWIFKYLSLVKYELFSTERFKCVLKSPAWGEAKSHCLHLCDFYPLCVCKCPLRSPAWEDAFPQCVFSNVSSNRLHVRKHSTIVALLAFVWFVSSVRFQMSPKIAYMRWCKVTLVAFVRLFSTVLSNVFLNCLPVDLHFMTFDILWHLAFHNIWHFMIFGISWHLPFHDISWHLVFLDIWHFMTFVISWHLAFHDIWHFMTIDISWNLSSSSCIMYHVLCIIYHISCIMYHVSCIMYHVSSNM